MNLGALTLWSGIIQSILHSVFKHIGCDTTLGWIVCSISHLSPIFYVCCFNCCGCISIPRHLTRATSACKHVYILSTIGSQHKMASVTTTCRYAADPAERRTHARTRTPSHANTKQMASSPTTLWIASPQNLWVGPGNSNNNSRKAWPLLTSTHVGLRHSVGTPRPSSAPFVCFPRHPIEPGDLWSKNTQQ